jgi:zinc and cadmium transporter
MNLITYIIIFNLLGSVVSLVGGLLLLTRKDLAYKISHYLSSFAAGVLLGTVFFDLLPEAINSTGKTGGDLRNVFIFILTGILFFFLLERFLHWFHHHGFAEHEIKGKPIVPLLVIGDTIHNFIDGVAIAATFATSIPLGMITTFAVGAHEIPQEIGDFGVMLKHGLSRLRVIYINVVSAMASFVGAILAFYFGNHIEGLTTVMLSITSGFFLYIALSDLIPEIHHENKKGLAIVETLCLLFGVFLIYFALYFVRKILHLST